MAKSNQTLGKINWGAAWTDNRWEYNKEMWWGLAGLAGGMAANLALWQTIDPHIGIGHGMMLTTAAMVGGTTGFMLSRKLFWQGLFLGTALIPPIMQLYCGSGGGCKRCGIDTACRRDERMREIADRALKNLKK